MFIFIAGTTSSGKSQYAELRASALGKNSSKIYIATAEILDSDSEMLRRVELHRSRRKNMGFTTLECPRNLGELAIPERACVLIESLTLWTANELFTHSYVNHNAGAKIYADFMSIYTQVKDIVLVSDDVFSDGAEYDPLTEEYLRILGGLHVKFAAIADEVIEVVAGLPITYKPS